MNSAQKLNRILNRIALVILIAVIALHGGYVWQASTSAETWEDRVFVIEREWHYRLLYPLAGNAIGFALPPLGIAYVNQTAAERLGTEVEGVRRHEGKHLEQVNQFGLRRYYQLAEWKREGVAEVVRGKPTANLCEPLPDENPRRLAYREFYVVTRYLMEQGGLSEADVYGYNGYPLEQAEAWLQEAVCV